jgi:hypothetical protein
MADFCKKMSPFAFGRTLIDGGWTMTWNRSERRERRKIVKQMFRGGVFL